MISHFMMLREKQPKALRFQGDASIERFIYTVQS